MITKIRISLLKMNAALFLLQASVSSLCAGVYNVPASEVPNNCTWIGNAACTNSVWYERNDSGLTLTDAGSPEKVYGKGDTTGTLDCNNCADESSTMNCSTTLNADFTEAFSAQLSSQLTVGGPVVEASLGSTIGAENGKSVGFSTTCGGSVPPETWSTYTVYQNVTKGRKAKISHIYTCKSKTTGGPVPDCPINNTVSQPGGSRTSTASGDKGSANGACESKPNTPCPPKDDDPPGNGG